jgi:GTPase SAR1 family protein
MFFHNTHVAVLVYAKDDKKSFDALTAWWTFLTDNPVPRVILVENKADLRAASGALPGQAWADSHSTEHLGTLFPLPFFETSAKTGQSVSDLFRIIATVIQEQVQPLAPELTEIFDDEHKAARCDC